jgi:hypothetical protein
MEIVQQIASSKDNQTGTQIIDHNWWSLCYILVVYQLLSSYTYICHI